MGASKNLFIDTELYWTPDDDIVIACLVPDAAIIDRTCNSIVIKYEDREFLVEKLWKAKYGYRYSGFDAKCLFENCVCDDDLADVIATLYCNVHRSI